MQRSRFQSPVGEIRMLASPDGLAAIYFRSQARSLESRLAPGGVRRGLGNLFLLQAEAFLSCYFDGDLEYCPHIRLDWRGTPFQLAVWKALRSIVPGKTASYRQLAARVGRPAAPRAVGRAVGANPLSILVPCHRVVGADGSLTGYAGGLSAKQFLLEHEVRHAGEEPQADA